MTVSRQVKEGARFPLDLDEETITPVMVDEPQTNGDWSLTHVIRGNLKRLE